MDEIPMDRSRKEPMRLRESRVVVDIAAPRERVWESLTEELGRWWPSSLVTGPAVRFRFEARVGGHLWEDWGEAGGLAWGMVKGVRTGEYLVLTTDVVPDLGGPARSIIEYTLEDTDDGTRLTWSESRFGFVDDEVPAGQWLPPFEYALTERLKPYAEGKPVEGDPAVEAMPP